MTVSKEFERIEPSAVKLTVTIGQEDVRSEYDKLIADYAKTMQIPGFRKGKVPRNILTQKFGEAFKGEALGRIIEGSISQLFGDESFPDENRPLSYATPVVTDKPSGLDLDKDLRFSVVYDIMPHVTLGPWKGLEIEVPDASVTEADINRELENLQERLGTAMDKEEGAPALEGDVITIDYQELSDAGEPVPGTERQDFVFILGSGANFYKLDDAARGMFKDQTKDIEKTYPEDFEDADLAGKTKKIRFTVTAIKERQIPELNDEFAQDVNEKFQTIGELKEDIRKRLQETLDRRLRQLTITALLEKIREAAPPIAIPESMAQLELESRWSAMARQFGTDGEHLEKAYLQSGGRTRESLFAAWRPEILKAIQRRLIVEAVAAGQSFAISSEDLENEYASIAAESETPLEEVKRYYERENLLELANESIREKKVYDLLLAENTIKKGNQEAYLDLLSKYG